MRGGGGGGLIGARGVFGVRGFWLVFGRLLGDFLVLGLGLVCFGLFYGFLRYVVDDIICGGSMIFE